MADLLIILTPIAVIDSLSMVPMAIVPLAIVFSNRKFLVNSVAFITGIFLPYAAAGVIVAVGLGTLFEQINRAILEELRNPNTIFLALQITIGVVLFTIGYRMVSVREKKADRKPSEPVTAIHAFTFAAGLVIVGLPGGLPYFAAIDQLLRANLPFGASLAALLYYNAVFVLPLVALVVVRQAFPRHAERLIDALGRVADRWGRPVTIVLLIVLGVVLVADGIGWFAGRPLLPVP